MYVKITFELDKEVLEQAKKYAADKKVSLSSLVENYLKALTTNSRENNIEISDHIRSISSSTYLPIKTTRRKMNIRNTY
jgi:hypothetical protein